MDFASVVVVVIVVMLIGLAGTLIPGLPGFPLIWLGLVGFVLFDRFQHLPLLNFLSLTVLAAAGTSVELWATQLFVRATGGSGRAATVGSCLTVLGLIFFTLPTALLIAVVSVFGIEWRRRKDAPRAVLSSAGWLVGWAVSLVVEVALAAAIILLFVYWLLG